VTDVDGNALSFAYTAAGTQLRTVTRATASGAADQTLTRVRCGYDSQPKAVDNSHAIKLHKTLMSKQKAYAKTGQRRLPRALPYATHLLHPVLHVCSFNFNPSVH